MRRVFSFFFSIVLDQLEELEALVDGHVSKFKVMPITPIGSDLPAREAWVSFRCSPATWNELSDAVQKVVHEDVSPRYEDLVYTTEEIAQAELCLFAPMYAPIENVGPEAGFDYRRKSRDGLPAPWCWARGSTLGRRQSAFPDQRRCLLWTYMYQCVISDLFLSELQDCDLSAVDVEPIQVRRTMKNAGWSLIKGRRLANLMLDRCEGVGLQGHVIAHDPPIAVICDAHVPAMILAVDRESVEGKTGEIPDMIFTRELSPYLPDATSSNIIPPQPSLLVSPKVGLLARKYMKSRARVEPVVLV